mmetsp:Transcript_15284/g.39464  ORF Transcript_15284/g.39464 Transcript_15284/m.39464 type:complete len:220 (-) Transcript_15284:164-823(-)
MPTKLDSTSTPFIKPNEPRTAAALEVAGCMAGKAWPVAISTAPIGMTPPVNFALYHGSSSGSQSRSATAILVHSQGAFLSAHRFILDRPGSGMLREFAKSIFGNATAATPSCCRPVQHPSSSPSSSSLSPRPPPPPRPPLLPPRPSLPPPVSHRRLYRVAVCREPPGCDTSHGAGLDQSFIGGGGRPAGRWRASGTLIGTAPKFAIAKSRGCWGCSPLS